MRSRISFLISLGALCAMFALIPSSASASYVSVGVTPSTDGYCSPGPDQISYRLTFKAKVKASGVAKPKKVRIGYQVLDADTRVVLRSGVVNLKKSSGYKGQGKRFTATAGQNLVYHLNLQYKSGGRTIKAKRDYDDFVPSAEALAQANLPAC